MGTRAAAFAAKIRNLQDYHHRIQHNILPLPSGIDVANTLKYFNQTLLSVLKDVKSIPLEIMRTAEKDHSRISLFPSLDYKALYHVVVDLVDSVSLVQYGAHILGQTILQTLMCLVPFLEHEYMDTLPYIAASSMAQFPNSLHKDIMEIICNHLLPFTIVSSSMMGVNLGATDHENQNYANMSVAAVIMMIFQYTDNPEHHCQLLECLMALKQDIVKDLLCVIAHGTAKARKPAVELLFHYWPTLNPTLADRKAMIASHSGWKPLICQRDNCLNPTNNDAIKMCLDHSVAISSGEHPPPLYVCEDCAGQIQREYHIENLTPILQPMQEISLYCEYKNCKSTEKKAVTTCFSIECASLNGFKPIRFCHQCNIQHHGAGAKHVAHSKIPSPWTMDPEQQSFMIEAIVSLLREAEPNQEKSTKDSSERHSRMGLLGDEGPETDTIEERQLLSRFGIWMTVTLCTPTSDTPIETLGRLLSMLFQWFHYTACLPDDQSGNSLERLKSEYIHGWLMDIVRTHFEVIVSCLVPHPADYSQVGGHWDLWPSQTNQIREGFKRLLCLVPYDIITHDIWDHIFPFWMESFRNELSEEDLAEMKILLSKVLDPDLSPLGFNIKHMYHFLSIRFENSSASTQEQALNWLQTLTLLEVPVPLPLLFGMFFSGIKSTIASGSKKSSVKPSESEAVAGASKESAEGKQASSSGNTPIDAELNITCYILMLDILVKQVELQEVNAHKGITQKEAQEVMTMLRDMIKAPWVGVHTCESEGTNEGNNCLFCEMCAIWYQLAFAIMEYFCPAMEVTMADIPTDSPHIKPLHSSPLKHGSTEERSHSIPAKATSKHGPLAQKLSNEFASQGICVPLQEFSSSRGEERSSVSKGEAETVVDNEERKMPQVLTATVKECDSQMDIAAAMPTEQVVTAFARAVNLTEDDVAIAKCTVASATLVDENDHAVNQTKDDDDFWHTSQGNFKFTIEELPIQLQLIYCLLNELSVHKDADVLYHMLLLLKLKCLHAEVLNKAAREHRGFLIWCQENLLVTNLWELLQAEFSQISQLCVPLLLHCITLPCGSDMFWQVVERDFHNENWRARYIAVERVTMIAHFVDSSTVKNSPLLQMSLANAFCYLVRCLDDIKSTVAQRALLNLENIKASSLKLLVWCLEIQFDMVIIDRPMILQTIYQLYNHLSNRRFLTWDFFLNRFDTLFVEAQINLEKIGELSVTRDLKNSNLHSEVFQKKLTRAHEALSLTHSSRSLAASFGTKWPYKRAMSAPGGMVSKADKLDKEKIYSRQSSAPVLKRKSSKLSGGLFSGGPSLQHFPNSFFPDGHLRELVQEETQFVHIIQRVMDMEDHDRDTLHLLIFLLMQFLSRPDLSHPTEEKTMGRNQHIVLRHLNILLGFSPAEKVFLISPFKLRASPVFNAFMVMMSKVLDYNFNMGNILQNIFLPILIYCPSPQRFVHEHQSPTYSLWLLTSHVRHSWLVAVLVILYKYQYTTPPMSRQIQMLIHIVLNTLEAQCHRCKHLPEPLLSPVPSRSRDLSTASVDLENIQERHTPPSESVLSANEFKFIIGDSTADSRLFFPKGFSKDGDIREEHYQRTPKEMAQLKARKLAEFSYSSDNEEEPELEAIPESPKSESTDADKSESVGELETLLSIAPEQACIRLVKGSAQVEDGLVTIIDHSENVSGMATVVVEKENRVEGFMKDQLISFRASYSGEEEKSDEIIDIDDFDSKSLHSTCEPVFAIASETDEEDDLSKHYKNYVNLLSVTLSRKEEKTDSTLVEMEGDRLTITTESGNGVLKSRLQPTNKDYQQNSSTSSCGGSPFSPGDQQFCEPNSKLGNNNSPANLFCQSSQPVALYAAKKSDVVNESLKQKTAEPTKFIFPPSKLNTTSPVGSSRALQSSQTTSGAKLESLDRKDGSRSPITPRSPKLQRMGALDVGSIKSKVGRTQSYETKTSTRTESPVASRREVFSVASNISVVSGKSSTGTQIASHGSSLEGLTRPIPERLLPIGPQRKDSKKILAKVKHQSISSDKQRSMENPSNLSQTVSSELLKESESSRKEYTEVSKAVQTMKSYAVSSSQIEIPALERLLPVGPLPIRKESDSLSQKKSSPARSLHKVARQEEISVFSESVKVLEKIDSLQSDKAKDDSSTEKESTEKQPLSAQSSVASQSTTKSFNISDFPITSSNFQYSSKPGKFVVAVEVPPLQSRLPLTSITDSDIGDPFSGSTTSSDGSKDNKKIEKVKSSPTDEAEKESETKEKTDRRDIEIMYGEECVIQNAHLPLEPKLSEELNTDPISDKNDGIDDKDEDENGQIASDSGPLDDLKGRLHYRQRRQRKSGIGGAEIQKTLDIRTSTARRGRKTEGLSSSGSVMGMSKRSSTSQSSSARCLEDHVLEHCNDCGAIMEEYSDEELGLCIVVLATFVHREPTLAAPLLPEMLRAVARIASATSYPWQCDSNIYLPGGAGSVARQFLRCVLHQLTPNGIFVQLFHSHSVDSDFFKTISVALVDFPELNQISPLMLLFENLNERKHLTIDTIFLVTENVATYLECLPLETNNPPWNPFVAQLEIFLRKLLLVLVPGQCDLNALLKIMICVLKMTIISSCKSILDPFTKIMSHCLQFSPIQYQQLLEICHLCNRGFSRERDKLTLTRTAIYELLQMLKFKSLIPDETVLVLVQFVLQDAGGTLVPSVIVEGLNATPENQNMFTTGASDCMRQNLNDLLEFLTDVHTLSKVKSNFHGTLSRLNEETLGAHLKAGMAQYLALEITKGNGRDNRAIGKYLPWLYHPPTALQQGPKEFIECVSHIRLLSWLLLGALQHSALLHNTANFVCQPIPLEANAHIAEHIQVILAGFAEQSKASVLHMSSLFHAFILCQLWTMYCEHMVVLNPPGSEQNHQCCLTLTDFWAKITPAILQLVCHSKVLAEMVSLHFLSLMEALMECNSTVLARLLPMWTPVLYSYHGQLPGHLQVRLQICLNWQPPIQTREEATAITTTFLKWLQRLQFKLGQIEMQSSAATQFYSM